MDSESVKFPQRIVEARRVTTAERVAMNAGSRKTEFCAYYSPGAVNPLFAVSEATSYSMQVYTHILFPNLQTPGLENWRALWGTIPSESVPQD